MLANKFALIGMTVTVTVGGGEGPPPLLSPPPPQASISPIIANETHRPVKAECLDTFRLASPASSSPANGSVNGGQSERWSARCCTADPVPVFGPLVVRVSDTAVVPDPDAIFVGSACPVLNTQAALVSGSPEQANVTSPANFVREVLPLVVHVNSGGAVTCRVNVWVLAAPPGAVAVIVTVELPCGVLPVVLTVNVTVCGGVTVFEGEKIRRAADRNPEQLTPTVPENPVPPATWKLVALEVIPCGAVIVDGFGAVRSTTCNTTAASCVVMFTSVPSPCALKL